MSTVLLLLNTRASCSYCAIGGKHRLAEWTNEHKTRCACSEHKHLLPKLSMLDKTSLKQAA
jgi:hypothetical protein